MPEHLDMLEVWKRQMARDTEWVELCFRIMDGRRTKKLTIVEFVQFVQDTMPEYRYGKRLAHALFKAFIGNDVPETMFGHHRRVRYEVFEEKIRESDSLWHIFMTLLPWKFADQSSKAYKQARDYFLASLAVTRVGELYAFQTTDSEQLIRFLDALQCSWEPSVRDAAVEELQ
eukprot:TRINITY_DN10158_c0_g1_i3.p1 TRINITY_DN10158_c0_g1~~TRINITY_DN10158_c0_g1_i3.p1  ORF type:complete len:173 (+),score=34.97 TRINITY_DN10158_c0_g1_i3:183-701(+)